jgi:dTDP-4-dehydrorhamnose reductase
VASGQPRLLIVGGDSSIGGALATHFAAEGWQVQATTRRRDRGEHVHPYLDLTAPTDLPVADLVILSAAVARIGDCAADPAGSRTINVDGILAVAEQQAGQGARVLLLSTDKVYDGTIPLRSRNDSPCPTTEYGRQKADAEAGVLALGDQGAVLRLSKVVEPGLDLLAGWSRALTAGEPITPFHDLYLAPVPMAFVARTTAHIADEWSGGIYHCTGAEDRSYVDLAQILARQIGCDPDLIRPASCQAANMPTAARPPHTTLDMGVEMDLWSLKAPEFEATAKQVINATIGIMA